MKSYVRLTEPMVREGGKLRAATWDEALDRAAEGFRKVRAEHGGEAIGIFSCSKATNEVNYLAQKFARGGHRHATTSTAATAPDTPPASSV